MLHIKRATRLPIPRQKLLGLKDLPRVERLISRKVTKDLTKCTRRNRAKDYSRYTAHPQKGYRETRRPHRDVTGTQATKIKIHPNMKNV